MKRLIFAIAIGIASIFGGVEAKAQLTELLLAGAQGLSDEELNKTIMWFDSNDKMKFKKVGTVRDELQAINITSNCKMIREFTYDGQPAYIIFRQGGKEGNEIGFLELYMKADPLTNKGIGLAGIKSLVYHNIGKDKEFCSIKIKKYVEDFDADEDYYITKQYRIDDNTANFIISFISNERFYQNASDLKFEEVKTPDIPAPIKSQD